MDERELEMMSAALAALAKLDFPVDIVELLVRGNPRCGIAPGALMAAINAAITIRPSFTCPKCEMTSYNPNDIAQGYCGNCHEFTARS